MRARIAADQYVKQAMQLVADDEISRNLGWLESTITMASSLCLKAHHNFGAKTRIPQFAAYAYQTVRPFRRMKADGWEELLRDGCLQRGFTPDEEENERRHKIRTVITNREKAFDTMSMIRRGMLGGFEQYKHIAEVMLIQERFYAVKAIITLHAFVLVDHFKFTPEAAMYFGGEVIDAVQEYGSFDAGEWTSLMKRACEENGIRFKGYWVSPEEYGSIPQMTTAQQNLMKLNWDHFYTDQELRNKEKYKSHLKRYYEEDRERKYFAK